MRHTILTVLFGAALAASASACGGDEEVMEVEQEETTGEEMIEMETDEGELEMETDEGETEIEIDE